MMKQSFQTHSPFIRSICQPVATVFLVVFFAVSLLSPQPSQAKVFEEDQVKAVFLYNLTKFVTWPQEGNVDSLKPFVIGVVGDNNFDKYLEKVVVDELVYGRKIEVRKYHSVGHVAWPILDLLFVTVTDGRQLQLIFKKAQLQNILTVGDDEFFCQRGGMINFLTEGMKIRIEVNIESIRKGGFRVSAQVLRLAQIVTTSTEVKQ